MTNLLSVYILIFTWRPTKGPRVFLPLISLLIPKLHAETTDEQNENPAHPALRSSDGAYVVLGAFVNCPMWVNLNLVA